MDARLDPAKYAGLAEGDAHVIHNAGRRASDDAIRFLVISYKLLGTREFFVIHHTDCGMEFFTSDVMRGLLASSLETAALTPEGFKDVGKGPAHPRVNTLSGLPSATRNRPSSPPPPASAIILWCPNPFRCTAFSTTSVPESSSKSKALKPLAQPPKALQFIEARVGGGWPFTQPDR
jgi:hypothetical protein